MNFKKLIIIIVTIFFISCASNKSEKTNLISPSENLKICNSSKYIFENSRITDSINDIKGNLSINNLKIICSNNSIYIFDKLTNQLKKNYKFKFEELKLELLSVELLTNQKKSKLLVITSSGQSSTALVFQIDLTSFEIDWLTENSEQITTGAYSNNLNMIALGTDYCYKTNNVDSLEYFSTLFLINSKTGEFIDYFKQGESVLKIKFSDNDKYIFAVLGWPHVDTYVWEINNKNHKTGVFGKDQTSFYDVCNIDITYFATVGSDGIYKWNITDPNKHNIVYNNYINGSDKIFKFENNYLLIDYQNGSANSPVIKYFDKKFNLIDSFKIENTVENLSLTDNKLEGTIGTDTIFSFDIKNKTYLETMSLKSIFKRIK